MMLTSNSIYSLISHGKNRLTRNTSYSPNLQFGQMGNDEEITSGELKPVVKIWQTNPKLTHLLELVFRNVKFIMPARDHTSGLTTLQKAEKAGLLKENKPLTLINVDSHSDLYFSISQDDDLTIANWVNKAILHYPQIKEVFWLMPEEVSTDPPKRFSRESAVPKYTSQTTIYVDRDKQVTYVEDLPEDFPEEDKKKLDTVVLHQITKDQLPKMNGKTVYLSVDMDYFLNTGYDTFNEVTVPYKGEAGIQKLFKGFNKANVRPDIVNLTISPEYSYTGGGNPWGIDSLLNRESVIATAIFLKRICLQRISKTKDLAP